MLVHRWHCGSMNSMKLYSVWFAEALLDTMFLCRELAGDVTNAANWIAQGFPVFIWSPCLLETLIKMQVSINM